MDAYTAEIRAFPFDVVPAGWLPCDGGTVAVATYPALASLIGTLYGGDGVRTIGLPDLNGRAPMGEGQGPGLTNAPLARKSGKGQVALTTDQIPPHTHEVVANSGAYSAMTDVPQSTTSLSRVIVPNGTATSVAENFSSVGSVDTTLSADAVGSNLGGESHNNVQPVLAIRYCICAEGLYPRPD
ncbi:tail fiber protein [Brevundimonas vitis]|uniref:Tail fiber protein n=1 Tax=Brevundimonas vitisensis TaxID=2800818 RepID=A0ABX7BT26_9CAUL|nr:tail fiber protein [Brevundimonas vitisensis]QQQ19471.1 tail fiber protein [Brevundimonas vitisensis]